MTRAEACASDVSIKPRPSQTQTTQTQAQAQAQTQTESQSQSRCQRRVEGSPALSTCQMASNCSIPGGPSSSSPSPSPSPSPPHAIERSTPCRQQRSNVNLKSCNNNNNSMACAPSVVACLENHHHTTKNLESTTRTGQGSSSENTVNIEAEEEHISSKEAYYYDVIRTSKMQCMDKVIDEWGLQKYGKKTGRVARMYQHLLKETAKANNNRTKEGGKELFFTPCFLLMMKTYNAKPGNSQRKSWPKPPTKEKIDVTIKETKRNACKATKEYRERAKKREGGGQLDKGEEECCGGLHIQTQRTPDCRAKKKRKVSNDGIGTGTGGGGRTKSSALPETENNNNANNNNNTNNNEDENEAVDQSSNVRQRSEPKAKIDLEKVIPICEHVEKLRTFITTEEARPKPSQEVLARFNCILEDCLKNIDKMFPQEKADSDIG